MAQKTSVQRTAVKPKKGYPAGRDAIVEITIPHQAPPLGTQSHSLQDDHLWDAAIENSIEAIRELADKALTDRQAGKTKKITI